MASRKLISEMSGPQKRVARDIARRKGQDLKLGAREGDVEQTSTFHTDRAYGPGRISYEIKRPQKRAKKKSEPGY